MKSIYFYDIAMSGQHAFYDFMMVMARHGVVSNRRKTFKSNIT